MSDDVSDLETLFTQHHKQLCNLAYNLVRDSEAAKDIVQEVFLKFWRNRDKIASSNLQGYLFKATSNGSLNYLRDQKKTLRFTIERSLENTLLASTGTESIGFTELEIKVREAIDRLPPKCRVIYLLSRQEGLKQTEIADTLNLSAKTVENQITIALDRLRQDLKAFITPELVVIMCMLAYLILLATT